jgi:hypothetical protein
MIDGIRAWMEVSGRPENSSSECWVNNDHSGSCGDDLCLNLLVINYAAQQSNVNDPICNHMRGGMMDGEEQSSLPHDFYVRVVLVGAKIESAKRRERFS